MPPIIAIAIRTVPVGGSIDRDSGAAHVLLVIFCPLFINFGQDCLPAALVEGKSVRCEQQGIDNYGRRVATCRVGRIDLSAAMVDAGLAIALPHFTAAYASNEARAREQRRGIWAGTFERPSDYRAAHPAPWSRSAPQAAPRRSHAPPSPSGNYYRGCNEHAPRAPRRFIAVSRATGPRWMAIAMALATALPASPIGSGDSARRFSDPSTLCFFLAQLLTFARERNICCRTRSVQWRRQLPS